MDTGGQRNVKLEGDIIKQELTAKKPQSFDIEFTNIVDTHYTETCLAKISQRSFIHYVPDTFYASNLIYKIHVLLQQHTSVRLIADFNLSVFTLYIQYQMLYVILKCHTAHSVDFNISEAINVMEAGGIHKFRFPAIFKDYFDALGELRLEEYGKIMNCMLPELIESSDYTWSPEVTHLLPHFRLILVFAIYHTRSGGVPRDQQTLTNFMNSSLNEIPLYTTLKHIRAAKDLIPGASQITKVTLTEDVETLFAKQLHEHYENDVLRYLQVTSSFLNEISLICTPIMNKIESYSLDTVTTKGTYLLTCIAFESNHPLLITESLDSSNSEPKARIKSYHAIRIKAKQHIVNGHLYAAEVTPVIRIAACHTKLDPTFTEPNSDWLQSELEFQSSLLTLQEMHAKFAFRR